MAPLILPQILCLVTFFHNFIHTTSWTQPTWNPHHHSSNAPKTSYTYYTPVQQDYSPLQLNPHPPGSSSSPPTYQHPQLAAYGPLLTPQFQGPYLPAPPGQRPYCAKEGQTYCEYVDYYPKKVILRLLQQGKFDLNTLLLNEKLIYNPEYVYPQPNYAYADPNYPQPTNQPPPYSQNYTYNIQTASSYNDRVQNKFNITGNENYVPPAGGWRYKRQAGGFGVTLCDQRAANKIVQAAMNSDGQWKFVVNLPESGPALTQRVTVQECVSPGRGCRSDLCTAPSNVRTRCVQQMVSTRLVSLHASGGQLTNEVFQLPSACVCTFAIG